MKRVLVLSLLAGIAGSASGQQAQSAPKPAMSGAAHDAMNMARYKTAITDARRKLFAAGMSNLTPTQLETFWAVYGDYEREKDAIAAARADLAKKYVDAYSSPTGVSDADLTQIVNDAAVLQKKGIDVRIKYFGVYSQKLNPKAAARFALIDDYVATAVRLNLLEQIPVSAGPAQ